MAERGGYTAVVYCIDLSPSMDKPMADPGGSGLKRTRLDWAKEFIARQCEPKIQSGRKTEHVGLVSFGSRTNNQANQAWMTDHPNDDDPPYSHVCSEVAIQTAKPKVLETLMNLQVGEHEGNPISALAVALDMMMVHKHSKAWSLEIVLLTDGESKFDQGEYEYCMAQLDERGIKLSVFGIDFQDPELPIEKDKPKDKRLSEKFWRVFIKSLHEQILKTTDFEKFLPRLSVLGPELTEARRPRPAIVNSAVYSNFIYIGSAQLSADQAIAIPVKYSKATMRAKGPSLSKAWKPAVEIQNPTGTQGTQASQLAATLAEQSQSLSRTGPLLASDYSAMVSSDVKRHSVYVIRRKVNEELPSQTQNTQATQKPSQVSPTMDSTPDESYEEVIVDKEDIVKAYRFGSTWIPVEDDTFDPMVTQKGIEVLGFIPLAKLRRHLLMGEARYILPDLTSPKGQIEFSSFVRGMLVTDLAAIVRFVHKDNDNPQIGVCVPEHMDTANVDFMYYVQLPFADDEHKFWFDSLDKRKTISGRELTEHPYIPTEEQCALMDDLVAGMDLDKVKPVKPLGDIDDESDEESHEDESDEDEESEDCIWFDSSLSYNPAIHRLKEAIFHASLTSDLNADPLGPPHPELTKYLHTPDVIANKVEGITERLKQALDIKKIPPKIRKRTTAQEDLQEDEGYFDDDFDGLFDTEDKPNLGDAKSDLPKVEPASPQLAPKVERDTTTGLKGEPQVKTESRSVISQPKPGRLISNEQPLEDFERIMNETQAFSKAIKDMGAVVTENVAASFSRQAFPLAIQCLAAAREAALMYEEADTYNSVLDEMEPIVNDASFKHRDFWEYIRSAGAKVSKISEDEAAAALDEY